MKTRSPAASPPPRHDDYAAPSSKLQATFFRRLTSLPTRNCPVRMLRDSLAALRWLDAVANRSSTARSASETHVAQHFAAAATCASPKTPHVSDLAGGTPILANASANTPPLVLILDDFRDA